MVRRSARNPTARARLAPVEGLPPFGRPAPADAILEACDGRAAHVPFPATLDGLRASAAETADVAFPRDEVSALLVQYARETGAPEAALANAARITDGSSLVVVTGQQPVAFGGPLYVLFKAAMAVRLAREAEAALGVPVVPVFWNASEDHDLDEVARAAAPGPGGDLARFGADLSKWRGREASAIGPDDAWRAPALEWAQPLGEPVAGFAPREDEGWSRWFSRLLSDALGPEGLVVMEPQWLRGLSGALYAGAVRRRDDIARLISQSCDERAGDPGESQFGGLGGPPLFMEHEGLRRRVVDRAAGLALKGTDASFAPEELAALAETEPGRFSSHAALRPVVQNALMPVVAAVLGPGEIAYHEELYRYHASPAGTGRRMPVLWPRLSATVLDSRAESTMARFGLAPADIFVEEDELVRRFTPPGDLAGRVNEAGTGAKAALEGLGAEALALDPTLERPLAKTLSSVSRAFKTFASKVGAAEARARGFAPERLRRLAEWVSPGGRLQERVFSWTWALARFGRDLASGLVEALDVESRRHQILRVEGGGEDDGG